MNTFLNLFTPYWYDGLVKERVGSNNDGGYIIASDTTDYDVILSGGAGYNISFEENLTKKLNTKCFIFDHSVKLNPKDSRIYFIKKKLTKNTQEFFEIIDRHNNVFLKLDIEGAEFDIISGLNDKQISKLKQLVIEFHHPYNSEKIQILKKLYKYHKLIHIHGNNCCGCYNINNILMPKIIEMSFIRLADHTFYSNIRKLPTSIDQPNLRNRSDIVLDYYPFVSETQVSG